MDARDYVVLIKRVGLSFGLFFLTRILFAVFNWDYFSGTTLLEMGHAVLHGLRFDLATTLAVNIFFILICLISISHKSYFYVKKITFFGFNAVFLLINYVDMHFFPFLGRKLTIDVLEMGSDITDQSLQIILNYWYMGIIYIATLVILWRFYPIKKETVMHIPKLSWWKISGIGFVIVLFTAIGIRGGVQMRSISVKNAFVFEKYELGNLAVSAAYTFIRSFENKKTLPKKTYFDNDARAVAVIKEQNSLALKGGVKSQQNVVIIIIESFSQEYIDEGYAPFFSELTSKGLYFSENYANGRRSLEALPSILAGIPSLIGKPLYQSPYQANSFYALPQVMEENGYGTSFFHGGKKGTMDFDAYCDSLGIDRYYSKDDYPNSDHFDGHWGIYDHHYLNYFASELDSYKEPFFSTIFTLSSHQPYSVPVEFSNLAKGSLDIHQSIRYVDQSLKLFFEKNKEKSWFENTLFVITADHTQKLETQKFNNMLGKYRVPLLFYHPEINLRDYNDGRFTQHADIMPSVLDFLGIENKQPLYFGGSVFGKNEGRMINFLSGRFIYRKGNQLVTFSESGTRLQNIGVDGQLTDSSTAREESLLIELKATIQYLFNGLKKNNLYSHSKQ